MEREDTSLRERMLDTESLGSKVGLVGKVKPVNRVDEICFSLL
jgi:hypothetical protein